jgi:DNA-binding transcriptional LysR family regulator
VTGAGVALIPAYVVADAIAAKRLEVLFEGRPDYDLGIYAAYLPSRHLAAKVRRFIDFLADRWRGTGLS